MPECAVYLLVGCSHDFIRSLLQIFDIWSWYDDSTGIVSLITPKLPKAFELFKEAVVYPDRILLQDRLTKGRDDEVTPASKLDELGFTQVRLRPMNAVAENRLLTRGQQLSPIVFGQL